MVARSTILQLGDVHYANFVKQWSDVDDKDKGKAQSPAGLRDYLTRPIPNVVAAAIEREIRLAPDCAVVLCGDLADRGDLNQFQSAAKYLSDAVGVDSVVPSARVHLVPGNHDVDLETEMPFVDLSPARFLVLQGRLDAAGTPIKVTTELRHGLYGTADGAVSIHSLNSTKANGAPRLFAPIALADPVADLLKSVDSGDILTDSKKLVATLSADAKLVVQEALDIPMLDPVSLDQIQSWSDGNPTELLVIAAHHGFLPQAIPRLGPYTEMVNGGQVRRRLLQLNRPVIYLHGHIHEDVVEVIRGTGSPRGSSGPPLVTIAAPMLSDGFNRLDIEFGSGGYPLGVVLQRIRADRHTGSVARSPVEMIPLSARRSIAAKHRDFFAKFMDLHGTSGADLIDIGAKMPDPLPPGVVEDVIVEACWSGVIERASHVWSNFEDQEFTFR